MILNTRPVRHQNAFLRAFGNFGHDIVPCPMLSLEALDAEYPATEGFDAVIFTSQVAIDTFPTDTGWRSKRVFAVGDATAIAALEAGFTDIMCTGENAVDLAKELRRTAFRQALFPSGRDVAADLAAILPDRVTRLVTYQAVATPYLRSSLAHRLRAGEAAYVPLFSPRSAATFLEALQAEDLLDAKITVIAMSPNVAAALPPDWSVIIAPHMTTDAMAETLAHILGLWPALAA